MRLVKRNIEYVTPNWVQAFWETYIEYLGISSDADVVVVGNTASLADAMVPEAILANAVSVGRSVTIVLDIGGHIARPNSLFEYHSVIAPSHYAQRAFATSLHSSFPSQGILLLLLIFY